MPKHHATHIGDVTGPVHAGWGDIIVQIGVPLRDAV